MSLSTRLLRPLAAQVSLVRLANERGADPASLTPFFPGLPCTLYESVDSFWRGLKDASADVPILLTGSLFLIGEVLAQRRESTEEYRLTERLDAVLDAR